MVLFLTTAGLVCVSPNRLGQQEFAMFSAVEGKERHANLGHFLKLQCS